MKHSIAVKFLAFVLCAMSLVTVLFSGTGIAFMQGYDLYQTPLDVIRRNQMNYASSKLAEYYTQYHAAQTLGNAPASLMDDIFNSYYVNHLGSQYAVEIYEKGQLVESINSTADLRGQQYDFAYTVTPNYPVVTGEVYLDETLPTEDLSTDTNLSIIRGTPPMAVYDEALARVRGQEAVDTEEYYDIYIDEYGYRHELLYTVNFYAGPTYDVMVYLSDATIMDADFMLVSVLYPYRDYYIPAVLAALVVFIVTLVFLFTVAGRRSNGEIHLAAINRIPLDLDLVCCIALVVLMVAPVVWLFESALYESAINIWDNPQLCLLICGLCGFGCASVIIGFLYAFAAQIKASNNYWMRHTVIGWAFRMAMKLLRYVFGLISKAFSWISHGLQRFYRGCCAVVRMLPIIWQWLLVAGIMAFALLITTILTFGNSYVRTNGFFLCVLLLEIIGCIAMVCYSAWCFGVLLKGVQHMTKGNLNHQIDTTFLFGCFKDFAIHLNSLAGAAQTAAQQQMKSERMRTELITNVSHDIKTPLTSIINYVDLLKKPHSEEDNTLYLDVLDRQSLRLKKLIDDLMEMSKASSGNMTVEMGQVDAVEAVNQALGEFADKLDQVHLTPVFRHPDSPVVMQADGRLVWRVLSNLLSNAVKYAMPDTRLYVDLMVVQDSAVLAIKNISRDQLNVNAEELMERFVRGDASRNTEGSGLGLNIAKSLVELQKGQMHLMVDGDLFKVTLMFPLA